MINDFDEARKSSLGKHQGATRERNRAPRRRRRRSARRAGDCGRGAPRCASRPAILRHLCGRVDHGGRSRRGGPPDAGGAGGGGRARVHAAAPARRRDIDPAHAARTHAPLPAAERRRCCASARRRTRALAFTVVATARAVDLWKLGADATVAAIDVLPARAAVEAALAAAAAVAAAGSRARGGGAARRSAAPFSGVLELDARVGALALSAARALAAFVAWTRVIPAANAVRTAVFK